MQRKSLNKLEVLKESRLLRTQLMFKKRITLKVKCNPSKKNKLKLSYSRLKGLSLTFSKTKDSGILAISMLKTKWAHSVQFL
jgi:hypothetical protein